MTRRQLLPPVAFLTILCLVGCDTDRLAQFGAFAAAGSAYATTFQIFTAEVGSAFIAADSAVLVKARTNLDAPHLTANAPVLRASLAQDDKTLKEYLANLQKLDAHAKLLEEYFEAMTNLTNGKSSAATVTSMDSLVDAIDTYNGQIEKVSFAGKNVKDFLGPATQLIVAHYEVKVLDHQLKKSAPVIDKALTLQQAAVEALSAQLSDSLSASLQLEESSKVFDPYVQPGPLPSAWAEEREAYLRQDVTLQTANCAEDAIKELHKAFTKLATDKTSRVDFKKLMTDIGTMAGYTAAANSVLKEK